MFKYILPLLLVCACATARPDPRALEFENKCLIETAAKLESAQNTCAFCLEMNSKSVQCTVSMGNILFNIKEFDKALAMFEQSLALEPKLAVARNNMGVIYFTKQNYIEAIAQFNVALEIDPTYTDPRMGLALAYFRLATEAMDKVTAFENLRKAKEQLKTLVLIDPEYPGAQKALFQITQYLQQLS